MIMNNSKLEVRAEAVRLAQMTIGTNAFNIVEVAKEIEKYIIDGIELPDVYDPNAHLKEMMDFYKTSFQNSQSETSKNWNELLGKMKERYNTNEENKDTIEEADFEEHSSEEHSSEEKE